MQTATEADAQESWAILELMGHVRLVGRISEEERFGTKMGRIDIPRQPSPSCPACKGSGVCSGEPLDAGETIGATDRHRCRMPDCNGFTTQFFSGQSIYRMTPVTEAVARDLAKRCDPAPVTPWELRRQLPAPRTDDDFDDRDEL